MKQLSTAFLFFVITLSAVAQKRVYFDFYGSKTKAEHAFRYEVTTSVVNEAGETRYFVKSYYMSDSLESVASYADKKQKIKDGTFVSYDEMGRKKEEMTYAKNELEGRYAEYAYNGRISMETTFKNDEAEGTFISYHKNGNVEMKQQFSGGKANGECLIYHENGQLRNQQMYVNDKKNGDSFEYYANGQLDGEERHVDGKLQGQCRWYHENGQVSSIEVYEADSLLHFELFNEDGTPDLVSTSPGNGPQYPGGSLAMRKFLAEHIVYPENALDYGLQGTAYLTFMITAEGRIKEIKVLRGVPDCPECDKEAVRVLKIMPKWNAEKRHNRSINEQYNLPITFKLH
jgi:TonB family protein